MTALDGLSGIDKPLQHLAGHPKTKIALHPRRHGSGEGTGLQAGLLEARNAHQWRVCARVRWRFFVAAGQDSRQNTGESKQNESVPEHGNLNVQ
ncbi:hypothetical protein [Pseudomonas savastanoi]|uniref:hypothetical protein n=1 Tax=Pseudomonas savastanoi TaxID=29438 RepID=UPI001E4A8E91|nr:hypothetical protein [Pseudomonas savastanoi]